MFLYVLEKINLKSLTMLLKQQVWKGGGGLWYAGMEMVTTLHAHTELSDKHN